MHKSNSKAKTPDEYLSVLEEPRKSELESLHTLIITTVPKLKPYIQSGMIGYGSYHYRYATGREGDYCIIGLASHKNYISVYVNAADGKQYVAEKYKPELPKASIGKSCIRFKSVKDIDIEVLKKILKEAEILQS